MLVSRAARAGSNNGFRGTDCKLCGKKLVWPIGRAKRCVLWAQFERGTGRIQVRNVTAWCRWLSRSHRRLPSRSFGMFLSRLPSRLPTRSSGRFLTRFLSRLPSSLLSNLPSRLLCRLSSGCSVDCLIGHPLGPSVGCLLEHLPFRLLISFPITLLSSMPRVQHKHYILLTAMFTFQPDTPAEAGCTRCFVGVGLSRFEHFL